MSPASGPETPLLEVEDLRVEFATEDAVVRAVDGVSLRVRAAEVVGLVGESGCGKSVTNLAVLGLLPRPAGRVVSGQIRFEGRDLLGLPEREMQRLRGHRLAMVFQDPMTAMNPYLTVGEQVAEGGRRHLGLGRREALGRAEDLLGRVGLPDPGRAARRYPHEFSGGMRQRACLAMALVCEPRLLLADEPTTALDVTIQAQILDLLRSLCRERGMAVVLVTHDLGVVAGLCDRVLVMYAGVLVEEGPTRAVFHDPSHPYTRALLASVPRLDRPAGRLAGIEGLPPRLDRGPFDACRFAPRCPFAEPRCRAGEPPLVPFAPGRARRCVRPVAEVR